MTDEELVGAGVALDDRFGAERAAGFGRALPGLVAELTQRWGLGPAEILDSGATSVVLAVTDSTGAPAVLKLSPDGEFLTRQSGMLRHLAPTGRVPAVLAESTSRELDGLGAVLLERVLPGVTVDDSRTTPPTPQEWAGLVGDLHGIPTAGITDLLRQRCEDMFRRIGARATTEAVSAHVPPALWARAVQDCQLLLETDREQVVIHGDLHLGNVLRSDERGLVAIDPKLCVGDRCFDLVDFVVTTGTVDQMSARAHDLAPLVGVDTDRLLRWCRVNAVVTAISRIFWTGPDDWTRTLLRFAQA